MPDAQRAAISQIARAMIGGGKLIPILNRGPFKYALDFVIVAAYYEDSSLSLGNVRRHPCVCFIAVAAFTARVALHRPRSLLNIAAWVTATSSG